MSLRDDHRQVVNGILWILRTGTPWRDQPKRYSKWVQGGNTVLSVAKSRSKETSLIRSTSRCGSTPKATLSGSLRRSNCDSCPPTLGYGGKKEANHRKN
ncbi:transposase [Microcoleus sp. D2_18a_D3]|uniref:transposase n=1 Tax=Microcoleus sp. D2_18a_D3 TaxID=3055330 RepID=UPI00403FAD35